MLVGTPTPWMELYTPTTCSAGCLTSIGKCLRNMEVIHIFKKSSILIGHLQKVSLIFCLLWKMNWKTSKIAQLLPTRLNNKCWQVKKRVGNFSRRFFGQFSEAQKPKKPQHFMLILCKFFQQLFFVTFLEKIIIALIYGSHIF